MKSKCLPICEHITHMTPNLSLYIWALDFKLLEINLSDANNAELEGKLVWLVSTVVE